MHVDLASGHSLEIVPLSGLKAKHKDAFEGAPKLYVKFDQNGEADLSNLPLSMTLATLQRNALLASLISSWSFTQDDGSPLPVPTWDGNEIANVEAFGEIPLDDINEIEDIIEPYIAKIKRRPDPKGTTTASSTGSSKDNRVRSRKG